MSQYDYSAALRQTLLQVARDAIRQPLTGHGRIRVNHLDYHPELQAERASFVTLNLNGRLRGCIGSLEAYQPLILDIAHNASAAAFEDPRFMALSLDEFSRVDIHISVLTVPEQLDISSRDELLALLQPGVDGLILEENGRRATYLPSVWDELPDPTMFVSELRRKAGLAPDSWSNRTTIHRYRTEEFS